MKFLLGEYPLGPYGTFPDHESYYNVFLSMVIAKSTSQEVKTLKCVAMY